MVDKRKKQKKALQYASAKERVEKHESGFEPTAVKLPDGVARFTFKKEGTYRIDILPYRVGKGNPFADEDTIWSERTFWVHRGIGPDSNSYCCLAKTFKKKCPICEHVAKLTREGGDDETIKALKPSERQLWNIKDLAEPDKGVQVMDQSHFLFGKLVDAKVQASDPEDNYENYFHLEGGMTLKVTVVQDSFGGRSFYKASNIEMKPRKEDYDEDILEETICLDECLVQLDYDDLKKIFLQVTDNEDEDTDDEDESPPKKPKGRPTKSRKPEPEDDDEDDDIDEPSDLEDDEDSSDLEDDEDEDEEPEPPKKRGRPVGSKNKKKPEPEDDDDDIDEPSDLEDDEDSSDLEDDDDDDEPEPPKKRGRPAAKGRKK